MTFHWHPAEQFRIGLFLLRWSFLATLIGVLSGTASAFFLISLDWATKTRIAYPWLVYFLPVAGFIIGLFYHYLGKGVEKGNNLLLEEIHNPQNGVPLRMSPLILISTIGSHLFGGSVGREGTAVQMGGSMASSLARWFQLDRIQTGILLMAGMSGGFSSVFGTPLAGMVFGLEVLAVGHLRYDALIPCLVSSLMGDLTCQSLGVHHTDYQVSWIPVMNVLLLGKIVVASLVFAMASLLFAELTHGIQWLMKGLIPWAPGRPLLGGLVILFLIWVADTRDYLGLGIPTIEHSFQPDGVLYLAFLWKIVFTAITIGTGFKGGEVTPLFFVGATLGSTLGHILNIPGDFLAALGFAAVFAAASNTPLACTIMGIELFGAPHAIYLGLASCLAYVWSGHRGIYLSQLITTPKIDDPQVPRDQSLHQVREILPRLHLPLFRIFRWGKNPRSIDQSPRMDE